MLVGERSAGLSGAYTALSDDPSGLYYNPAGIVYSPSNNLSASVNAYQGIKIHYDNVGEGDLDWDRKSSTFMPNFFGIIKHVSFGTLGISYAVTESLFEDQDQEYYNLSATDPEDEVRQMIINYNNEEKNYNFGPSFAFKITDNLSLGTTLYAHYRKVQFIDNEYTVFSDNEGYEWTDWYNDNWEETEWGIKPILGLMWLTNNQKISVGLTLSRTFILDSDLYGQRIAATFHEEGSQVQEFYTYAFNSKRKYPFAATLGVAYFPSYSLLFTCDLSYYAATNDNVFGDRRPVFNGAFGIEYYPKDSVALRTGLSTNMASTYDLEKGKPDQEEHVNMYGMTLSISYFSKGKSITLGTLYSYGKGETTLGQWKDSHIINDMSIEKLMFFISASTAY